MNFGKIVKYFAGLTSAVAFSCVTQASIVSYNGYALDSSSGVISKNHMQWLSWIKTDGMSVKQALTHYGNQGWSLASNQEMANLFSDFFPGKTWTTAENGVQRIQMSYTDSDQSFSAFINLFGATSKDDECLGRRGCTDTISRAIAIFGDDTDNDNRYKSALVEDAHNRYGRRGRIFEFGAYGDLYRDYYSENFRSNHYGIALTRKVAAPAGFALILLGMGALTVTRRRTRKSDK